MEKITEYKKGEVSDESSKEYRFQCDCQTASDAMDISVLAWGEKDEGKIFIISMTYIQTGLWENLKNAWRILRGHWSYREFILREEDIKPLIDILNPDKKFSELP